MLYVGARNKQLKQETPCDARFAVEPSGFQMPFVTTPIMTTTVCVPCPQAALPLWLPPLRRTREHVTAQPLLGPSWIQAYLESYLQGSSGNVDLSLLSSVCGTLVMIMDQTRGVGSVCGLVLGRPARCTVT